MLKFQPNLAFSTVFTCALMTLVFGAVPQAEAVTIDLRQPSRVIDWRLIDGQENTCTTVMAFDDQAIITYVQTEDTQENLTREAYVDIPNMVLQRDEQYRVFIAAEGFAQIEPLTATAVRDTVLKIPLAQNTIMDIAASRGAPVQIALDPDLVATKFTPPAQAFQAMSQCVTTTFPRQGDMVPEQLEPAAEALPTNIAQPSTATPAQEITKQTAKSATQSVVEQVATEAVAETTEAAKQAMSEAEQVASEAEQVASEARQVVSEAATEAIKTLDAAQKTAPDVIEKPAASYKPLTPKTTSGTADAPLITRPVETQVPAKTQANAPQKAVDNIDETEAQQQIAEPVEASGENTTQQAAEPQAAATAPTPAPAETQAAVTPQTPDVPPLPVPPASLLDLAGIAVDSVTYQNPSHVVWQETRQEEGRIPHSGSARVIAKGISEPDVLAGIMETDKTRLEKACQATEMLQEVDAPVTFDGQEMLAQMQVKCTGSDGKETVTSIIYHGSAGVITRWQILAPMARDKELGQMRDMLMQLLYNRGQLAS